jgi:hypothetical protein
MVSNIYILSKIILYYVPELGNYISEQTSFNKNIQFKGQIKLGPLSVQLEDLNLKPRASLYDRLSIIHEEQTTGRPIELIALNYEEN